MIDGILIDNYMTRKYLKRYNFSQIVVNIEFKPLLKLFFILKTLIVCKVLCMFALQIVFNLIFYTFKRIY